MDREETVLLKIVRRFGDKSEMTATYPFTDGESAHKAGMELVEAFKKRLGGNYEYIVVDEDEAEIRFDDDSIVIISVIYQEHLSANEIIDFLDCDGFFLK